jgi:hypothetical protein
MGVEVSSPITTNPSDVAAAAAAAAAATGQAHSAQQGVGQGQQSGGADRGYPENTPVAEMTDGQRAAYYKHHNRQAENRLQAFKGVTPEQLAQIQQENENLRNANLSASDKAIKDAQTQAAKEARAEADSEWSAKYLKSELKSLATSVLKDDKEKLAAFMAVTDPKLFAGENGEIDEEKVMGHLTALFGGGGGDGQQKPNNGQQQRSWGQHSGGAGVPARPGDAGRAAAQKRFGTAAKTT